MGYFYRTATPNLHACRPFLLWMCPTIISAARWVWKTLFCMRVVSSVGDFWYSMWGFSLVSSRLAVLDLSFQSFLKHIPGVFVCTHYCSLCVWSNTPQLLFWRGGVFRPEVSICPQQSVQRAWVFLTPNFQQLWSCMPCAALKQKLKNYGSPRSAAQEHPWSN